MKNSQYRLSKLKYQLNEKKENHEKYAIWRLSDEQLEYVQSLGYEVIPWIYSITTEKLPASNRINGLMKDVHYSNLKGRKTIYRKVNRVELNILKEKRIRYKPLKFKIFLQ